MATGKSKKKTAPAGTHPAAFKDTGSPYYGMKPAKVLPPGAKAAKAAKKISSPDVARAGAARTDLARAKKEYLDWMSTTKGRQSDRTTKTAKRAAIGKKWGVSVPEYFNK